jgi:hypothetical protein
MQVDHRVSGNSVWIGAEGLGQTLKVLHVTDSHISGDGETEAGAVSLVPLRLYSRPNWVNYQGRDPFPFL